MNIYNIEVISIDGNKAFLTIGASHFVAYHESEVTQEEIQEDAWDWATDSHYTRGTGRYEVNASTQLLGVSVLVVEDDDQVSFDVPSMKSDKVLCREIENAIACFAIAEAEANM